MTTFFSSVSKLGKLTIASAFIVFSFSSCVKNTSSDSTLVGNWVRSYEFEGVGRTEAVSFTIGTVTYVGGGYDGTKRLQDFWKFDGATGTWTRVADFPGTARNSAFAFGANGKGYVGGGYDGDDNKLKDFWEYDPTANAWTQKTDFLGTARIGATTFVLNDKGYVCGGYDGSYLKDLWMYDPLSDEWIQRASLAGSKRMDAVAFTYNNNAYLVTGVNNGSYLADFWSYNPSSNSWTQKRSISDATDSSFDDDYSEYIKRSNAVIFVIGSKAYLTTGTRNGIISSTWEYDITTDLWKEKTAFEGSSREGAVTFVWNGVGYVLTGSNSTYRYDDMFLFHPDDEVNTKDN